ncbi:hypothetical protein D9M73_292040 [compost metagenome]
MVEQGFTDLHLALETQAPGDRRQAIEEIPLTVAVFRTQRADQHMAAIVEFFDPVIACYCSEVMRYLAGLAARHDMPPKG